MYTSGQTLPWTGINRHSEASVHGSKSQQNLETSVSPLPPTVPPFPRTATGFLTSTIMRPTTITATIQAILAMATLASAHEADAAGSLFIDKQTLVSISIVTELNPSNSDYLSTWVPDGEGPCSETNARVFDGDSLGGQAQHFTQEWYHVMCCDSYDLVNIESHSCAHDAVNAHRVTYLDLSGDVAIDIVLLQPLAALIYLRVSSSNVHGDVMHLADMNHLAYLDVNVERIYGNVAPLKGIPGLGPEWSGYTSCDDFDCSSGLHIDDAAGTDNCACCSESLWNRGEDGLCVIPGECTLRVPRACCHPELPECCVLCSSPALTLCAQISAACVRPTNTVGMNIQETNLDPSAFDVTVTCQPGSSYHGDPRAIACRADGQPYTIHPPCVGTCIAELPFAEPETCLQSLADNCVITTTTYTSSQLSQSVVQSGSASLEPSLSGEVGGAEVTLGFGELSTSETASTFSQSTSATSHTKTRTLRPGQCLFQYLKPSTDYTATGCSTSSTIRSAITQMQYGACPRIPLVEELVCTDCQDEDFDERGKAPMCTPTAVDQFIKACLPNAIGRPPPAPEPQHSGQISLGPVSISTGDEGTAMWKWVVAVGSVCIFCGCLCFWEPCEDTKDAILEPFF